MATYMSYIYLSTKNFRFFMKISTLATANAVEQPALSPSNNSAAI
jgi:hypothetical protein